MRKLEIHLLRSWTSDCIQDTRIVINIVLTKIALIGAHLIFFGKFCCKLGFKCSTQIRLGEATSEVLSIQDFQIYVNEQ